MKKIILTVISVLFIIVFASSCGTKSDDSKPPKPPAKIYSLVPDVENDYNGIENYIAESLRQKKSKIDISKYGVSIDDLPKVYRSAIFTNPDIFYVDAAAFNYDHDKNNNIYYVYPEYIVKKKEIPDYIKKFNKSVDDFLKNVDNSLSDFEKALTIHDKIISDCIYTPGEGLVYTAYGALVNKKAVCEGYARAYSYLLYKAEISNKCLDNGKEFHCWNLVQLDKKWYHVDLTDDDPIPDTCGYVSHEYFLLSDSKLNSYKSEEHIGYESDITYNKDFECNSKSYDSSFFRDIFSCIYVRNNAFYYIDNNYQNKHYSAFIVRKDNKNKVLASIKDRWYSSDNEEYTNSFSKLCYLDGYFFYNTPKSIHSYNINSCKDNEEYKLPNTESNDFYGVTISGSYIVADKKKSPTKEGTREKILYIDKNKSIEIY